MTSLLLTALVGCVAAVKINHCTYTDEKCQTGSSCTTTEVAFNVCSKDPDTGYAVKSYRNENGELCTASYATPDCSGPPIIGTEDCWKDNGCYKTANGSVQFKSDAVTAPATIALLSALAIGIATRL